MNVALQNQIRPAYIGVPLSIRHPMRLGASPSTLDVDWDVDWLRQVFNKTRADQGLLFPLQPDQTPSSSRNPSNASRHFRPPTSFPSLM
jgi:hypothetical protein